MDLEPGYATEKQVVLTRLRRVEGQVRGLQRLVDEELRRFQAVSPASAAAPRGTDGRTHTDLPRAEATAR